MRMGVKTKTRLLLIQTVAALVLAGSFFLPVTRSSTFVDDEGRPLGLLGQMFSSAEVATTTSYSYFWEDPEGLLIAAFFAPLVILAIRWLRRTPRFSRLLDLVAPIVAVWCLVVLAATVWMADFSVLPGSRNERAFGGYVALAALGCFVACATMRALAGFRTGARSGSTVGAQI